MISLPFFFIDQDSFNADLLTLSEETSKHVVQVLRKKEGDILHLTNGKGILLTVSITEAHKKKAIVKDPFNIINKLNNTILLESITQ